MKKLGANTWIWVSPLTDERLTQLAPRVRDMGFDVIELPIEQLGDWSPEHAAEVLAEHGLSASIAVAMAPGRELCGADAQTVATTQAFLRECLDVAATVGAGAIAGPIYTSTGRTWRITPDERVRLYAELRENLAPVADYAGEVGVKIGIEPLVRYETSLINTVEQALEAIDRAARFGRAAARHLPRQRGGEGLRRVVPARRSAPRARARLGQRPRRPRRRPHRLDRLPRRDRATPATTARS